jgi:hypothetical protein
VCEAGAVFFCALMTGSRSIPGASATADEAPPPHGRRPTRGGPGTGSTQLAR